MRSPTKVLVLVVAMVSAWTMAQTTRPAAKPYEGRIVGKDVNVRAAPWDGYACVTVSAPAKVTVMKEAFGWLRIAPPAGCHSLIHTRYVKADADGKTGTVAGTNVNVRAGSDLLPKRMEVVQTQLNTGDKVTILGTNGEYYKIAPPAGVGLWVAAKFVRKVGAAAPAPTTTGPVMPTTVTASAPTTTGPVVVTTAPADAVSAELAAFEAAERALEKEFKKPRDQRNLPSLLAQYQAIQLAADSPLAIYVNARVKYLQGQVELAKDIQTVDALVKSVEANQARYAAERSKIKTEIPATQPTPTYTAEGLLGPSRTFAGAPGAKRYALSDANQPIVRAYCQCTTGVVDLAKYVGSYVGVIGTAQFDAKARVYVVEAERIIVIRPPSTRPAPKPATTQPVTTQPTAPPAATQPVAPKAKPVAVKPVNVKPTPMAVAPAATQPAKTALPPTGLPVAKPATAPSGTVKETDYE